MGEGTGGIVEFPDSVYPEHWHDIQKRVKIDSKIVVNRFTNDMEELPGNKNEQPPASSMDLRKESGWRAEESHKFRRYAETSESLVRMNEE